MKRLLVILLLALPATAQVYQRTFPDCMFGFTYNVTASVVSGNSRQPLSQSANTLPGFDNRTLNCVNWQITYQSEGVTASSLELDQAPSAAGIAGSWITWATPALGTSFPIALAGAGAVGQATAFGYEPFVSINLNSATGTGTVSGFVYGWRAQAQQDVTQTATPVTLIPGTRQGWTYKLQNGLSTTVQTIKATAGELGNYYCYNPNAAVAYIQIFDVSGTVTLGTTTPAWSIGIPTVSAANLELANGLHFGNAIKVASTTTATGSTANASGVDCNFGYQ